MKTYTAGLVEILKDIVARVEAGDSFEGNINYTCMDNTLMDGEWQVSGSYRIDNSQGQGGMRVIS